MSYVSDGGACTILKGSSCDIFELYNIKIIKI